VSAAFPWNAAQVLSATTATPREVSMTRRTPGTARARAGSNRRTVPPNTGQRASAANTIPGARASSPKMARPVTLAGVSTRGTRVPRRRYSDGRLSAGFSGTGSVAARSASCP
jgi:hypothetical protein